MNTALLVIDAQQSFAARPSWAEADPRPYLVAQQALIDAFAARGLPVVQILHTDDDPEFRLDSGLVRTLDGLRIAPTVAFTKTRHSALVGTGLEVWLRQHGIGHLVVSGIRTEQCCETTTRHASDLGFGVRFVTEATHTLPHTHHLSGERLGVAAIQQRTELALRGRFAQVCSVADVVASL